MENWKLLNKKAQNFKSNKKVCNQKIATNNICLKKLQQLGNSCGWCSCCRFPDGIRHFHSQAPLLLAPLGVFILIGIFSSKCWCCWGSEVESNKEISPNLLGQIWKLVTRSILCKTDFQVLMVISFLSSFLYGISGSNHVWSSVIQTAFRGYLLLCSC